MEESGGSLSSAMADTEITGLKEALFAQHHVIRNLSVELEKEREASAISASEALSMVSRLQREKAEVNMEANQYKRMAEETMHHSEESRAILEELVWQKETETTALKCQLHVYRQKFSSIGLSDQEIDKMDIIENLSLCRNDAYMDNMDDHGSDIELEIERLVFPLKPSQDKESIDRTRRTNHRTTLSYSSDREIGIDLTSRTNSFPRDKRTSEMLISQLTITDLLNHENISNVRESISRQIDDDPPQKFDVDGEVGTRDQWNTSEDSEIEDSDSYFELIGQLDGVELLSSTKHVDERDESEWVSADKLHADCEIGTSDLWNTSEESEIEDCESYFERIQQLDERVKVLSCTKDVDESVESEWVSANKELQETIAAYSASLKVGSGSCSSQSALSSNSLYDFRTEGMGFKLGIQGEETENLSEYEPFSFPCLETEITGNVVWFPCVHDRYEVPENPGNYSLCEPKKQKPRKLILEDENRHENPFSSPSSDTEITGNAVCSPFVHDRYEVPENPSSYSLCEPKKLKPSKLILEDENRHENPFVSPRFETKMAGIAVCSPRVHDRYEVPENPCVYRLCEPQKLNPRNLILEDGNRLQNPFSSLRLETETIRNAVHSPHSHDRYEVPENPRIYNLCEPRKLNPSKLILEDENWLEKPFSSQHLDTEVAGNAVCSPHVHDRYEITESPRSYSLCEPRKLNPSKLILEDENRPENPFSSPRSETEAGGNVVCSPCVHDRYEVPENPSSYSHCEPQKQNPRKLILEYENGLEKPFSSSHSETETAGNAVSSPLVHDRYEVLESPRSCSLCEPQKLNPSKFILEDENRLENPFGSPRSETEIAENVVHSPHVHDRYEVPENPSSYSLGEPWKLNSSKLILEDENRLEKPFSSLHLETKIAENAVCSPHVHDRYENPEKPRSYSLCEPQKQKPQKLILEDENMLEAPDLSPRETVEFHAKHES